MYGHRMDEAVDSFIADEERDHRQNDRRGEPGEVAELASAEGKATVAGMPARIAIRQSRQQQSAGVGRHMQSIGNQREGAEKDAADHLQHHHPAAKPDHGPGLPLRTRMSFTKKDVAVTLLKESELRLDHDLYLISNRSA